MLTMIKEQSLQDNNQTTQATQKSHLNYKIL